VEDGPEAAAALTLLPDLVPWLTYALLGVFVGFFAGLLGVGGGSMIVPVLGLTFVAFGFSADQVLHLSLGTSLAAMIVSTASSAREHHRFRAVRWDLVKGLAPGIVLGGLAAGAIARAVPVGFLKVFFLCFMAYVAAQIVFGLKVNPGGRKLPGPAGTAAVGGAIGGLSALAGVGGAMLSVPFMMYCSVPFREAIATSSAVSLVVSLSGTVGFVAAGLSEPGLPKWSVGYVYLPALVGISVTSVFVAPYGARAAHRIPVATLKKIFALLLLALAAKLAYSL
jgi:uncharacterized membrane protein YfcA